MLWRLECSSDNKDHRARAWRERRQQASEHKDKAFKPNTLGAQPADAFASSCVCSFHHGLDFFFSFPFLSAFAIVNSPFFPPQLAFNLCFCLERERACESEREIAKGITRRFFSGVTYFLLDLLPLRVEPTKKTAFRVDPSPVSNWRYSSLVPGYCHFHDLARASGLV
jgi:hypothetical protein